MWLLIILATCSLSFGQTENSEFLKDISGVSSGTVLAPGISTALEKPIDPKLYRLGPGDKLEFRVWGIIEVRHILQVGPDGFISIPTIGSLEVAGKTIVEAESLLVDKSRDVYPRSKISFRLTRVRMMKVLISGAVENPGVYELSAIDRLSSLIEASGGFIERKDRRESDKEELSQKGIARGSDKKEEDKKDQDGFTDAYAAQRQIRINNRSGSVLNSVLKVDYLQYKKTGNLNFNPVLEDGDQVHVPIMDVEVGVLRIFGAVKEPGEYEYVNGDSLLDLVDLAGGFKVDALLSDLQIVRFNADDKSKEKIQVNVLENIGQNRGPQLQPDDCVFVREIPDFRVKHHVTVKGEVNFPGVYSIIQDVTTLTDIIEASGGFAERANIKSASVVRKAIAEIEDPEYERLKKMTVGEMNEMEYEYFKTRSREEAPAVVVDFQKLFIDDDKNLDITLRDKDEIDVPVQSLTVNVTGQVNRPGLIHWIPGKSVNYYIDKAGGFSWNARKGKMRLIKAQTGKWTKPSRKTPVEIGDTIFVPEKLEINYWEMWKDMLLVVSQIATIILVIRSV